MMLIAALLGVFSCALVQGSEEYLNNGWYRVYQVCGEGCVKQIEWEPMGSGDQAAAKPEDNYGGTSWFVHHKGNGVYSFTTSCSLDCNTWKAKDGVIKARPLKYKDGGVNTLFKLETDGVMSFKGDQEYKYKVVLAQPGGLAGKVVNVRGDDDLGYGDASGTTRFIIKRNYSIVSGCNCRW